MKLSIIVPVYNEEDTVSQVLENLFSVRFTCSTEIIVVDDGSTDNTRQRLKRINSKKITVILHGKNLGKGQAIKTGIRKSTGDYILIQDADLEYDPGEIPQLLYHLPVTKKGKPRLAAVYGSRFKNKSIEIPFLYLIGNKFFTLLTNLLYATNLTDMETGYKLLPSLFLKKINLKSHRFDVEPEITAKLLKRHIPIIEVPISYQGRSHLAGKKLTALDGFEAVKALLYYRFFD